MLLFVELFKLSPTTVIFCSIFKVLPVVFYNYAIVAKIKKAIVSFVEHFVQSSVHFLSCVRDCYHRVSPPTHPVIYLFTLSR